MADLQALGLILLLFLGLECLQAWRVQGRAARASQHLARLQAQAGQHRQLAAELESPATFVESARHARTAVACQKQADALSQQTVRVGLPLCSSLGAQLPNWAPRAGRPAGVRAGAGARCVWRTGLPGCLVVVLGRRPGVPRPGDHLAAVRPAGPAHERAVAGGGGRPGLAGLQQVGRPRTHASCIFVKRAA